MLTSEEEAIQLQKFYIQRNNLFIQILILIRKYTMKEKEYFYRQIDSFIKINNENILVIELDVDFFFLSLLGFHHKAKSLLIKNNEYFKNFIKEYRYIEPLSFFDE